MSADEHLNPTQFFHVSPHPFEPGSHVTPQGRGWANFDESSGEHVYFTAHEDRAQEYHYMLWQQGHRDHHIYEVEPTGKYETDPNDAGALRSKEPLKVWGRWE